MKLRSYQQKAVEAVLAAWLQYKSCLVVLPTGCGKTVVFGEVIKRIQPKRTMILAHREELIRQATEKVSAIAEVDTQIEMGEFRVNRDNDLLQGPPQVVVSTVQTQITGRMYDFEPTEFGSLVIDEAHHAVSPSYRECIEHYLSNPDCRLLGVTVTPDRKDEAALGKIFDTVAFEYTISDAINDGWLVPIKQRLVSVNDLDFSGIATVAGDFNQGELAEILEEEKNLHGIANPTIEICGSRRAIIFAASVRQAERLAEIINRTKPNSAAFICGKTDRAERSNILTEFKLGNLQFVVNVGVLTEGFDDSGVEVVVMARPTKSRALYAQMAGRATRPAAEIADKLGEASEAHLRREMIAKSSKPGCLIVDFVGNSGRHKLITTIDILGGKDPDDIAAMKKLESEAKESGKEINTAEELEKIKAQIIKNREVEAKRRAFITATVRYSEVSVDPFNIYDLQPLDQQDKCRLDKKPLSYKQRKVMIESMRVNPNDYSAAEAKQLINEYFRRIKEGLPTFRQSRYLRLHGIPVPMKKDEASRTIDWLIRKNVKVVK